MARTPSCPLCERPGPYSEATLCEFCSAHPVLVRAFAEGRARLAETATSAKIVPDNQSHTSGS